MPVADADKTPYPCRCACGCRRETWFGLLCVACRVGDHIAPVKQVYRQTKLVKDGRLGVIRTEGS